MRKTIQVTDFYHTEDYDKNYDRNRTGEYVCECCGRKLNPKTMKQVQMLESGHWTNEEQEVIRVYHPDDVEGEGFFRSQGFWYIGPKCYKEIMKRVKESGETLDVEVDE